MTDAHSPFIRTVLGDIPPDGLGVCYAHEHIIIDPGIPTRNQPAFLLDSVEAAVRELAEVFAAGGRSMVDSMPCDSGRNVVKLAEVSRRSGIRIIAPTGLHLEGYYPADHWSFRYPAERLARLFVADIEAGIDRHDYGGPLVERTPHRAGVIKIAGGRDRLSAQQKKVFRAAAIAHCVTGCPILTHTEQGTAALEQVDLLAGHGVDLRHVVLSHTDRIPDPEYHREILATGVRVEYDSCFRWKSGQPNRTLELVLALTDAFPTQILLGMDAARRNYWKAYGGAPGLVFLVATFSRMLRDAGLTEAQWNRIFIANPAAAYAFAPASAPRSAMDDPSDLGAEAPSFPPVSYSRNASTPSP